MKKIILLVEADELVRESLKMHLESRDLAVIAVANEEMALKAIAGGGFDLALLDLNLKVHDRAGIKLTRAIVERKPGTTIVIMSGDPSPEDVRDGLKAGAAHVIGKPFQPLEELDSKLGI